MTLDGLLTVLALAAAIYAVLTPVQQQRVSLTWRPQLLLAVPAFSLMFVYELLDFEPPACPPSLGDTCQLLVLGSADPGPPRKFAFLIACLWLLGTVLIHAFSKPSLSSLPAFTRVATTLIDEEQFGDALKLLEPHIDLLARAGRRKCLRQRLHDWLEEFGPPPQNSFRRFLRRPEQRRFSGESWPEWAAKPVRLLAYLIPAGEKGEHAASDLLELLLSSPQLFDYIVSRRPYFALSLVGSDISGAADFLGKFLAEQIRRPGSALYQEIANNDIADGMVGYRLPARNRLLHFLFADAKVGDELSAWKGVGDYLNRLLGGDERPDYWEWLNGRPDWFERDQMRDPTFVGMFFFDIMVTAAAKQGVRSHMWLYYFPSFAERLEMRYDSTGDGIDCDAEFPTRSARLLFELVRFLTGWVETFERLPEGAVHRVAPERPDYPWTVPHAAAQVLGTVLATVVMSEKIDERVIQTLHDMTLRAIRALHPDEGEVSRMRAYLIRTLLNGGHREPSPQYLVNLAGLLDQNDDMLEADIPDYVEALEIRMQ